MIVTEITTAEELARLSDTWSSYDFGAYNRYETHILNDIDCTGVPLQGTLRGPLITGYDNSLGRPVQRTIYNVEWTLEPNGYSNFEEWTCCKQCEKNNQQWVGPGGEGGRCLLSGT